MSSGRAMCAVCGCGSVARILPVCGSCLRQGTVGRRWANAAHRRSQSPLPPCPPRAQNELDCGDCANRCRPAAGERSFCGLRENVSGVLVSRAGNAHSGLASWYSDAIPTNCVSAWVCPASTGVGYPDYAVAPDGERGHASLAVFLGGCSHDCLFCQNRTHQRMAVRMRPLVSPQDVAESVDADTTCLCFFGGDPTPQVRFALHAADRAREMAGDRILRICWETNGSMARSHLRRMARITAQSGGCSKFDLKTADDQLYRALTGVSGRQTWENFRWLARLWRKNSSSVQLTASTPLITGYVDAVEVRSIAGAVADVDPTIPYSLLAFYPNHPMRDLSATPRALAEECRSAALEAGLQRVRPGNTHLLS